MNLPQQGAGKLDERGRDHRVFCQGLEAVFAAEPDFEPMAISNSDQVLPTVTACTPDTVLMDVRIGRANGIDLTRRLTAMSSPPAVVVLTAYADTATAIEAIRAGQRVSCPRARRSSKSSARSGPRGSAVPG